MSEETNSSNNTSPGVGNELKIQQLLKAMVDNHASDLHLTVGSPPVMRIHGDIVKLKLPPLNNEDTKRLLLQIISDIQKRELEKNLELDFSFGIKGLARFRGNIFYSKGGLAGAFRLIPTNIPDFKALGLPNVLLNMIEVSNGMILVTGPTGSGKSTTLASLLDIINQKMSGHIITLEDPIEFVHQHKSSIVNQREVGSDTLGFAKGLRSMLRQDPDVVLVGELRDVETIEAALTIAETGHLVFGTLHTNSCVQTINRMINVFPSDKQTQVRTLLSFVIQGVVSQQLIPRDDQPGRVMAMEIMVPNSAIRNLIREDKVHQIHSQMQIGQEKSGMITMNQVLAKLVKTGVIESEKAMAYTTMPEELAQVLGVKK